MPKRPIRLGLPTLPPLAAEIQGELAQWRGDTYYRIAGYDRMDPFFISVVSDSDLWMYISSNGGLTAGRRNTEHSLFPYETVDKLHESHTHTGPKTVIRCMGKDDVSVWQPFANEGRLRYEIERSLYKHALGCELWFEVRNRSLGLTFRYGWRPSDRFGWVRTAELENTTKKGQRVEILDGVQNLLPAGVHRALQDSSSCLVDAYKSSELDPETMLATYRLTANIIDRAEASEALRATVAWQMGLPNAVPILDRACWERFILGQDLAPEAEFNGRRGSYLLRADTTLGAGVTQSWSIVLDTPVDQPGVVKLKHAIKDGVEAAVEADIQSGRDNLHRLLAGADALQVSGDPLATTHHVANVLFNIARGGVLPDQYRIDRDDFADFLATRNRPTARRNAEWLDRLPASMPLTDLHRSAEKTADKDLVRLCFEYLPIVFSRRHGDPSRPWNQFSIIMKNPDGSPRYAYEGNWRDIFQNWEALCRSFPECLEPIIAKFVNASTIDGFNPYRITREGIDWEIADPDDPWSSIGYWGDHQIVYLTKLLEASLAHHPERLTSWLSQDRFCYADVPYDIKAYDDIVADPQDTITFNWKRQQASDKRVDAIGSDGKLVHGNDGIVHVNLAEKLLVPILAKLSNLVPEGGIWMNTMRPEWNDANNALVGNGMSVVTACYLYRHLGFCADLFAMGSVNELEVSSPVVDWLTAVDSVLTEYDNTTWNDKTRRAFMDAVGEAFSAYRTNAYTNGLGGRRSIRSDSVVSFLRNAAVSVGATVKANRRDDGLYHGYNILHLSGAGARVSHLPPMLEGQVAALSSGCLEPEEAAELLEGLRASSLYREDQHTYVLYPARQLPAFLEKNRVPDSILSHCPTLAAMVEAGDQRIVIRDRDGQLRFHADLHNADAVQKRLTADIPDDERAIILDTYETVFNHKAFTGRSGTMYGYEGIGCIYWHMVAKLLVAVQEVFERAVDARKPDVVVTKLRGFYDDIRAGLGFVKSPDVFGAFPLDPYSHTPAFAGAKQPGMTGQVKEEILTRWGELGVRVDSGKVTFDPRLLQKREFLEEATTFTYVDTSGSPQTLELPENALAFTFCQVPVVYVQAGDTRCVVRLVDGSDVHVEELTLPEDVAAELFARTGRIERITVHLPATP